MDKFPWLLLGNELTFGENESKAFLGAWVAQSAKSPTLAKVMI